MLVGCKIIKWQENTSKNAPK